MNLPESGREAHWAGYRDGGDSVRTHERMSADRENPSVITM